MTILAVGGVANFSVFGFGNIPMYLTPFASLILTSIIIPRASFVGHLSGILVGFLVRSTVPAQQSASLNQVYARVGGCKLRKGPTHPHASPPIATLILQSILNPRLSLVGHLRGILVGFIVIPLTCPPSTRAITPRECMESSRILSAQR